MNKVATLQPVESAAVGEDALARNARPGATVRIIHDTACTGFALRIYPNGRRTWGFTYRVGEKRGNIVLGPYVEVAGHMSVDHDGKRPLTLSEARALARSYRTKVEAGIEPFAAVAAPLKFKDLALLWLIVSSRRTTTWPA